MGEIAKRKPGRPFKYTAKSLMEKGLAYFQDCVQKKEPITITGLALALGTTRKTLCEYEEVESNPALINATKKLKAMVEYAYEKRMWDSNNPAAGIFCLKNMGWTDRQDIDINAKFRPSSYTEEEETELRELARLRALGETAKAITAGSGE